MTIISGKLREVVDLYKFAFLPDEGLSTNVIGAAERYTVQLVTRTREPLTTTLKNGQVIEVDNGRLTRRTYDGLFGSNSNEFVVKISDRAFHDAEDLQLVVRDRSGRLVYRSRQVRPGTARSEPVTIYLIPDIEARLRPLRTSIENQLGVDPFAGLGIPSDFRAHLYEGMAADNLDTTTQYFVDMIEAGDFPGIGKEKVATTSTSLELSGNTFEISFGFSKPTKQLTRYNTGGPPMVPTKRFLTIELEGRVLITDSLDPHRYATAEVLDVNVKSTKALVIVGAPFTNTDQLIPQGTADAITDGLNASISPLVDVLSRSIRGLAEQHLLLEHLADYFDQDATITLTAFDTRPIAGSRTPQLRPVATLGFPGNPFAR
jgi:hypothetical protein